ncbi:energy transducer TonB [Mannheimia granulomatis]|uniref:TonB family protein n=1 Tax=Mannheimia granulomatis TaxID=85402 RepID=UPI00159E5F1C|nr:TonB family protein [Mannheimia granulomatis]QLB15288.1 energy transducer TonB [Mannheimia granulomatis]
MRKKHSHIGLITSLAIHSALIGGGFVWLNEHKIEKAAEQNALSLEMVAALLEQPQVAVAPEPVKEESKEIEEEKLDPKPEPDAIPDPTLKPKKEKPKEDKPKKEEKRKEPPKKEKPKEEKPKEKPKPKENKPVKALEKGIEAKQGIVAKAIPNAIQGEKEVKGVLGGQKNGSLNSTSTTGSSNVNGGNANEISAYKAALQRALQRKANNSYPQREKMMRKTGTVTIKFSISASGAISNVSVLNSSGNSNLDAAAVRSAEGLNVSPPPAGFPTQVTVPVKFAIE